MTNEQRMLELGELLAKHDAEVATCPVQRKYYGICPRCKAISSDTCGVVAQADYAFIEAVRASLKAQSTDTSEGR